MKTKVSSLKLTFLLDPPFICQSEKKSLIAENKILLHSVNVYLVLSI